MVGTDTWTVVTILLLACVTVVARCFFFISSKPWKLPAWADHGLQYAPIAALSAVVFPEVVMAQGQLITTWQDARLYAVAAGVAFFYWRLRQGQAVLGTIHGYRAWEGSLPKGLGW